MAGAAAGKRTGEQRLGGAMRMRALLTRGGGGGDGSMGHDREMGRACGWEKTVGATRTRTRTTRGHRGWASQTDGGAYGRLFRNDARLTVRLLSACPIVKCGGVRVVVAVSQSPWPCVLYHVIMHPPDTKIHNKWSFSGSFRGCSTALYAALYSS